MVVLDIGTGDHQFQAEGHKSSNIWDHHNVVLLVSHHMVGFLWNACVSNLVSSWSISYILVKIIPSQYHQILHLSNQSFSHTAHGGDREGVPPGGSKGNFV